MIELTYSAEVGDEFEDTMDNTQVTVTSIDVWQAEVGFTRRKKGEVSFHFEIVPIVDFETAVRSGLFKQIGSSHKDICWHSWDTYVGFSWTYKFCNKCGVKKT